MPVAAGTPELPAHGRVTIIGAGIAGCSVAYHLSELGWSDVVVIDQGPLFETGGSTSHAPGLVFVVNFSKAMTRFAHYTTELYDRLRLNGARVWNGVGGLEVAWTPQRLVDLKRKVSAGRAWGVETHLLGADEARARLPLLSERIHGAMYTPADGVRRAARGRRGDGGAGRRTGRALLRFDPGSRASTSQAGGCERSGPIAARSTPRSSSAPPASGGRWSGGWPGWRCRSCPCDTSSPSPNR